jgi:hypothetical protein
LKGGAKRGANPGERERDVQERISRQQTSNFVAPHFAPQNTVVEEEKEENRALA